MRAAVPRLQLLLAVFPIALGAFVLAGAEMFPAWLIRDMPGFATMGKNSALCFVLCGTGLLAACYPQQSMRRVQAATGAAVVVIASLVLLQSMLDYQPTVSAWHYIFNARADRGNPLAWPGEMCHASGVAFLFAGMAVVQMTGLHRRAGLATFFLGVAILGIAQLCLLSTMLGNVLFYSKWPVHILISVPTGMGLIAIGAALTREALRSDWFQTFYRQREDRRIFVTGIALFTVISLVAGLVGIAIVGRYAMTNFQDALWTSFRSNGELFRTSVNGAVARSNEIVRLSGLESMVNGRVSHADLLRELERIVQLAGYEELASLKIVNGRGETLARTGRGAFSDQFNVLLPMPVHASLYWQHGWRLLVRIPLGESNAMAEMEVALHRFDHLYTRMNRLGVSGETRICIDDNEWMRCFPSRLSSEPSRFPMYPTSRPLAMNLALNGEQGVTGQLDYRGNEVIAAYGMIETLGLGMVQKFDTDEFYQPLREQLWYALLGLSLLIVAGASVLYWRTRPLVSGLVRTRARLDAILNNVPAGVVTIDGGGFIFSANRTAENMFGCREDELLGMHFGELLQAENTQIAKPIPGVQKLTARRRNGEEFHAEMIASDFLLGNRTKRIAIIQDVTQRRALESQVERWGHVFKHAGWGMTIGSADGTTLELMNPAFAEMHGYRVKELTGRPIVDVLAPEVRDQWPEHIRMTHAHLRVGFESLHLRKDGGVFPVWIDITAVKDAHGTVLYRAMNVLDISERKESERRLRELSAHMESVREEERKSIAREVHDELGQALTVLRMEVSLLRLNFGAQSPQLMERILAMKEMVDRTIHMVRDVTSALRPPALDLGLTAALEWLVEDLKGCPGINCVLRADDYEVELDDSQATALFRIAQESLTNVLKHADANEAEVSLHVEQGRICLRVRDNGRGFSNGAAGKTGAFGLLGIRERALMLGGEVEIESVPDKGTCVSVCLPLRAGVLTA